MRKEMNVLTVIMMILVVMMLSTITVFASAGTDWDNGKITVEGYGAPPMNAHSAAQARMMTRRAAIVDAYQSFAEEIQGVNVDAESTVKDMETQSNIVKTKVTALIKGAKIISEETQSDGGYRVVMQISMYGVSDSLANAVMPVSEQKVAFPTPVAGVAPSISVNIALNNSGTITQTGGGSSAAPVPESALGLKAIGGYTGLIVDCRGLDLNPVMSPVIKNGNGQPIYGYKNLDSQKVISNGMASYMSDTNSSSRAGNNPLIIKAVNLESHNSYPIISVADANRVLVENAASGFLDNCAVVFIR